MRLNFLQTAAERFLPVLAALSLALVSGDFTLPFNPAEILFLCSSDNFFPRCEARIFCLVSLE